MMNVVEMRHVNTIYIRFIRNKGAKIDFMIDTALSFYLTFPLVILSTKIKALSSSVQGVKAAEGAISDPTIGSHLTILQPGGKAFCIDYSICSTHD